MTSEVVDIEMGRSAIRRNHHPEGPRSLTAGKNIKPSAAACISAMKIIVISSQVDRDGLIQILDWFSRDAEPRMTLQFLVSKEDSARDILEKPAAEADVFCFELNNMLRAQKSLSYADVMQEYQFLQDLAAEGISATLPTVYLKQDGGKPLAEISGTPHSAGTSLRDFLTERRQRR